MIRSACVLVVIATTLALSVFAGEPPRISAFTIDGGGVMYGGSEDNRFALSGTIGQPDAGVEMFGGDFRLTGGFWFETYLGDCNGNGFRDLVDHNEFTDCMGGPSEQVEGACRCFETSGDGVIDLLEFQETQNTLSE